MSGVQTPRPRLGRTEARDVILEAAARVFNLKGRAATVEDIAQEAGYSTSALYKHFSNKDDIFRTLWKVVGEQLLALYQTDPLVDLPFVERLKWTLYRIAQFAEDERELLLASFANTPSGGSYCQVDQDVLANFRAMQQALIEILELGIDEGVLRRCSPQMYEMALSGHLRTLLAHWAFLGPFPLKPKIDELVEFFLLGAASEEARGALLAKS